MCDGVRCVPGNLVLLHGVLRAARGTASVCVSPSQPPSAQQCISHCDSRRQQTARCRPHRWEPQQVLDAVEGTNSWRALLLAFRTATDSVFRTAAVARTFVRPLRALLPAPADPHAVLVVPTLGHAALLQQVAAALPPLACLTARPTHLGRPIPY
jgi:hypothetical protein